MKTPNILTKIDTIYTNITKKIIGNMPLDTQIKENQIDEKEPTPSIMTDNFKKVQDLARDSISHIKKVGIKNAVLTLGTPNNDDLLYDNVIKRENNKDATGVEKKEVIKGKITQKTVKNKAKSGSTEKKPTTNKKEKNIPSKVDSTKKESISKTSVDKKEDSSTQSAKEIVENKPKVESKPESTAKKPTANNKENSPTKIVKDISKKKPKISKVTSKKETIKKETKKKTTVSKKEDSLTKTVKETNKKKTKLSDEPKKSTQKNSKKTGKIKISKREEKMALYAKDITKHYGEVDEVFLALIVKNLGPSIYRETAELVSCSEPKELYTVRKNFLINKLGIDASKAVLDSAIQDVCEDLKGVEKKYRATFYYRLAKKFKKESALS